jgi:hypothetical protein
MKPLYSLALPLALAILGSLSATRADTILLSDDFSGASLDATKWTAILPYSSSSVVQSGGTATTTGRGILATVDGYSEPYVINGAFTMLADWEHFNIAFRTDLSTTGAPYYEVRGTLVSFSNDSNEISIQERYTASDWNRIANISFNLNTGQTYFFRITDTGSEISLAVNGITELTAQSAYSTGDQIAFYSREFPFTATSIDTITITSVPDAGITVLYLGLTLPLLAFLNRRKRVSTS